ncbi:amidophosphoribosyltransferase [Avibacterium sp. 21-586]|uniref:amidophosphoribosyltransferase n=1 Tax=Avibacterium sp. 21-586 TaxID=2911534 RepID=UPI002246EBDB|nr:amidophosphoribosyltransferase [Avibacterium sp. 21-586]MCW9710855.1 amidophosphoribosyltransferase [Avibacterium sp. 21-586]
MNFLAFRCILCHQILSIQNAGLCSKCSRTIERYTYCGCCGMPTSNYVLHCGCCLNSRPYWDQMVVIGRYTPPLSEIIKNFKFQHQFWLDKTLARLLLLAVIDAKRQHFIRIPEIVIPVPLHHFRQWKRGYNQSHLIAKHLAKWLNIPCHSQFIQRIKRTPPQLGLNAKARKQNLRQAFKFANQRINYRSIALVDDVITTGSTLNEIAKHFRQLGVENIQVWGLARAFHT